MITKNAFYDAHAVGRRKTSIARVYVKSGTGKMTVNKRNLDNYFPKATDRYLVNQPLNLINVTDKYDFNIKVRGGGTSGQAVAIRLGIARILLSLNGDIRPELKKNGFLTRDSRKVERKKAGLRGARRKFQFSKR